MNRTQQRKRRNAPPLRTCKGCGARERRDRFGLYSNMLWGYCADCINRAQRDIGQEGGR